MVDGEVADFGVGLVPFLTDAGEDGGFAEKDGLDESERLVDVGDGDVAVEFCGPEMFQVERTGGGEERLAEVVEDGGMGAVGGEIPRGEGF